LNGGGGNSVSQHRGPHLAALARGADQGPAEYNAVRPISIFGGPGYLYVPRKGIVDKACNLPTGACPNEMRDVNY
jgi:hypothetical protein